LRDHLLQFDQERLVIIVHQLAIDRCEAILARRHGDVKVSFLMPGFLATLV
jgi:hypothetical protein